MHIPDGYLGPQTYGPLWLAMLAIWGWAGRVLKRALKAYQVPLLAISAAFVFVIMMFNIPIPGGTSGHATGAALVAILLGPWAAAVAVSVALIVQALLFGDGGITALGANCFTMAVVMPFSAYAVYRMVAGRSGVSSARRWIGGALAGYVGLNMSALATAVLFGIQPMLAHTPAGQPLYSPYPLWVAVPAMMSEHLVLFGLVEAAVTALVIRYLQRADPALLEGGSRPAAGATTETAVAGPAAGTMPGGAVQAEGVRAERTRVVRRLATGIALLVVLTPVGLLAPAWLGGGSAWGEWSSEQVGRLVGYVPGGMAGLENAWRALLPDYAVAGWTGTWWSALGYMLSAVVGVAAVVVVGMLLGGLLAAGTRRGDYVERTLRTAAGAVREAFFLERWARADGLLQRTDARFKLVAAGAAIVAATLIHSLAGLLALYLLTLAGAVLSRIPVGVFIRRVWLFVPLFTGVIVLPATLNLITPGPALLVIARLGPGAHLGPFGLPAVVSVTAPGASAAVLLVARVATCVSLVVLLSLTTRWSELMSSLRALRVPAVLVMAMEMSYRYVFVLIGTMEDMYMAKRSRTLLPGSPAGERWWVATRVGAMFRRSHKLTGDVYQAMLARGYDGQPRALDWERRSARS